jgi:hypothetical protein
MFFWAMYLLQFGIVYGHLAYFIVILVYFSSICMLYQTHLATLPGLQDGLFSNQKSQFGYILDGLT